MFTTACKQNLLALYYYKLTICPDILSVVINVYKTIFHISVIMIIIMMMMIIIIITTNNNNNNNLSICINWYKHADYKFSDYCFYNSRTIFPKYGRVLQKNSRKNYVVKYNSFDNCVRATDCIYFQYFHKKTVVTSKLFFEAFIRKIYDPPHLNCSPTNSFFISNFYF